MDYQIQDIETIHQKFQTIIDNNHKWKTEVSDVEKPSYDVLPQGPSDPRKRKGRGS